MQGQWRIGWYPIRPVLKHGPRSLTCARVRGFYETLRRSESEAAYNRPRVGRMHTSLTGNGPVPHYRPPQVSPSKTSLCGALKRTRWYPKDGELCLGRLKPREILVEGRSGSDVQIDRMT